MTLRDCHFCQLKFLKYFDYRYYLLSIYTSQQQFYLNCAYCKFLFNLIMSFKIGLKKNNKLTKKPVNRFLQDGASACIQSLQTSIIIELCQTPENGL